MKGSVLKRGKTWTAYWDIKDPATGERKQQSKGGFRVKKDAQAYLHTVLAKLADGTWHPDRPMTVEQLLTEHWLPAQKSRGLKPTTLAQYRHVTQDWIVPHIGAVQIRALTPAVLQTLIETLRDTPSAKRKTGLSDRSLQMSVVVMKAACAWALKTGLLGRNPLAGMPRPRVQQRAMKVWPLDDARRFLDMTKDDRLAAAWALLLTRGLRRGELCGLCWDSVDLEAKTVTISRTRIVVDGKAVESSPKTASSRRSVPLDDLLVARLKAHRARQAAERLIAGSAYDDGDYLFTNELGRPYHPDWISDRFEQLVQASGLDRIRLHDTRHTAATLMLASGVPTKVVSEMLGHGSITITLAVYAHVLPGMSEEAGAALSASLLG
jgi:integrase